MLNSLVVEISLEVEDHKQIVTMLRGKDNVTTMMSLVTMSSFKYLHFKELTSKETFLLPLQEVTYNLLETGLKSRFGMVEASMSSSGEVLILSMLICDSNDKEGEMTTWCSFANERQFLSDVLAAIGYRYFIGSSKDFAING